MKKILSSFAFIAFFAISFTACKKDKPQSNADKIIGVWHLDNYIYNEHISGQDNPETNTFGPNDVYEFKKDGTVRANIQGEEDTSTYSLADNKLTIVDDETYDIKTLNANTLILYYKETSGADYAELTITFKR